MASSCVMTNGGGVSMITSRSVTTQSTTLAAVQKLPHVLTVAGSDSGGGAGIQADIKACGAHGAYCSSVITAVTAQNTVGVQRWDMVSEELVKEQLRSVLSDMHVDVVKTGMLPSAGVIKVLCNSLREFPVRALVVDPVMVSTSGHVLSASSTLSGYQEELFQMADIVTPNLKEASALLGGISMKTVADMCSAAKAIHGFGPRNVLVKGGDLPNSLDAIDILFDGEQFHELRGSRIATRNTHGTGCTLASSIAAELAKGSSILEAVQVAKRYVEEALNFSKDLTIGNGPQGPFDHLFNLRSHRRYSGNRSMFSADNLFLYAVTDSRMNKKWGRSMTEAVQACIDGGATIVQLREKETSTREFIEAATSCLEVCQAHHVPLIINDRVDVALACDADGVHVGQSDMSARKARELMGPTKIVGVSCKTPAHAEQAFLDGADYIGSGGVFPTNTKENNTTIGLDGLKSICLASKLPVVAIGGIGIGNARSVMKLGVEKLKGVAVVSALFDRESVVDSTRKLKSELMAEIGDK